MKAKIGAGQIRAARALLDWSQDDLAKATDLSIATIRKLELGYISPRQKTTSELVCALETAGIEFIEPEGVRRKRSEVEVYEGVGCGTSFWSRLLNGLRSRGGDIFLVAQTHGQLAGLFGRNPDAEFDYLAGLLPSSRIHVVVGEGVATSLQNGRIQQRIVARRQMHTLPFCLADGKYAVLTSSKGELSKIIALESAAACKAARECFESIWGIASGADDAFMAAQ